MNRTESKIKRRARRKQGLRKRSLGVPSKPRLTVFRSSRNVYAQLIDDLSGRTLLAASTQEKTGKIANGGNCDAAKAVGKNLAERATAASITSVVFDRNGYQYHGRIKALADAAREGGLKF